MEFSMARLPYRIIKCMTTKNVKKQETETHTIVFLKTIHETEQGTG